MSKKKNQSAIPMSATLPSATPSLPPGVTSIPVPKFKTLTGNETPAELTAYLQDYQNQANQANNQRYEQGLGVLGGVQSNVNNLYGQALGLSQQAGQSGMMRIANQEQQLSGKATQSAIGRGLGNTTVVDALQSGVQRDANDARATLSDQLAQRSIGIQQNQAQATQQNGNQIANYIAQRNDTPPDTSMYASLMQQAAAAPKANRPPQFYTQVGNGMAGGASIASIPSQMADSGFFAGSGSGMAPRSATIYAPPSGPSPSNGSNPNAQAGGYFNMQGSNAWYSDALSRLSGSSAATPSPASAGGTEPSGPLRWDGNMLTNLPLVNPAPPLAASEDGKLPSPDGGAYTARGSYIGQAIDSAKYPAAAADQALAAREIEVPQPQPDFPTGFVFTHPNGKRYRVINAKGELQEVKG